MVEHFQKTNRDTQWAMTSSNDTWILTRNARIETSGMPGIYESGSIEHSNIRILGDVKTTGGGTYVVSFQDDDSSVYVGKASHLDGRNAFAGVAMNGASTDLVNRGLIQGQTTGVYGTSWGSVENHGTIAGKTGVYFGDGGFEVVNHGLIRGSDYNAIGGELAGSSIVNEEGGVLRSLHEVTIETMGSGSGTIENHGLIKAPSAAIIDGIGDIEIINTGRISGNVYMGDGSDTFDGRRGSITGSVYGGDDGDTYYIGKSSVKIVEAVAEGYDYARSTVSYKLTANVESLELLGKKDIDASGELGGNRLIGNSGDNVVKGFGGSDNIDGGAGRDTLTGGSEGDTFVFRNEGGRDTITDFEDHIDKIRIDGVIGQSQFDDLEITDVKGGALIEYQGGEILVKGMAAADFGWMDDFTI
ncbi:calcium-binding protein [Rhizobium sp. LjRoot254]|uniref:calcium-binding protein n=1 Tax=Rhizobium sp. LjRoot254 TaxID=3342297 RepID=UPI003ED12E31